MELCHPDVDEDHDEYKVFMRRSRADACHHMNEIVKTKPSRAQWIFMDTLVRALGSNLLSAHEVGDMYTKAHLTKKDISEVIDSLLRTCKQHGVNVPNMEEASREKHEKAKQDREDARAAAAAALAEDLAE